MGEGGEILEMKLFVKTYGCQMNEYDSARMIEALLGAGWTLVPEPEDADLMLYNSCSIREKAEQKLISGLGLAARIKRGRPGALLAVTGCTAQLKADMLVQAVPDIDLLVGPDVLGDLPRLVKEAREHRVRATGRQDVESYSFLEARPAPGASCPSAYVTIMKGCDNRCAYCVVPEARGPEVSRDAGEVLAEVQRVVEAGAREVFLIGQNVNSYRGHPGGFPALLRQVGALEGVERIRFTTSHPKDLGRGLVEAMAEVREVCQWLHLPVQAGSTAVLEAMGRGYSREEYLQKVAMVREPLPEVGLTTDVIVGFPGETLADFLETMSLLEAVRFDSIYSFRFSPREGTPAAHMKDDVPHGEKAARLSQLQALQETITREILAAQVGRVHRVMVEGPSRRGGGQQCGRNGRNHVINFAVPDNTDPPARGELVDVEVTAAGSHTLEGRWMAP